MVEVIKNTIRVIVMISVISFTFDSCDESSVQHLSPSDYMKWMNNSKNGLINVKVIDGLKFTLQYRTTEAMIISNNNDTELTNENLSKEINNSNNLQHIRFRISMEKTNDKVLRYNISNKEEYINRIAYMSFDMQEDFSLIEEQDTLVCKMFHFVRNYELAPYVDFVLAFENSKSNEVLDKVFIYDDKIFGFGKLKFRITAKNLKNKPKLIID